MCVCVWEHSVMVSSYHCSDYPIQFRDLRLIVWIREPVSLEGCAHKADRHWFFHRPNIFMCTSEMPASFAVMTAPILKLWAAYWLSSKPACRRVVRSKVVKVCLVR